MIQSIIESINQSDRAMSEPCTPNSVMPQLCSAVLYQHIERGQQIVVPVPAEVPFGQNEQHFHKCRERNTCK